MKTLLFTAIVTVAALISGCATTLKAGAEKVKISDKAPPASCSKIGKPIRMYAIAIAAPEDRARQIREVDFKNEAFDSGGNYVQVKQKSSHRFIGTVFRCP